MEKTQETQAPATTPKVSAGDAAIAASVKAGGNVKQLRKALWSIRGDLKVTVAGTKTQVNVVKAEIVKTLDAMKDDAPAPYTLGSLGKGGYELLPVAPAKK